MKFDELLIMSFSNLVMEGVGRIAGTRRFSELWLVCRYVQSPGAIFTANVSTANVSTARW